MTYEAYLPPGYNEGANSSVRYLVVYLLHGAPGVANAGDGGWSGYQDGYAARPEKGKDHDSRHAAGKPLQVRHIDRVCQAGEPRT